MIDEHFICASRVAARMARLDSDADFKFAAACIRDGRLKRLPWFLQGFPGGMAAFVPAFLEAFPERVGSHAMRRIAKTSQTYTAAERKDIASDFPWDCGRSEWQLIEHCFKGRADAVLKSFHEAGKDFFSQQNHAWFLDVCLRFLNAWLPDAIAKFCQEPGAFPPSIFCFDDLSGALLDFMEMHAARATQSIALTAVAAQVFDTLDFALGEKTETGQAIMVSITGDSRFGKSEAAKARAAAFPGQVRLVKTPCTNDARSLFEAIALALGIEHNPTVSTRELKSKLAFVLNRCGLMLIFDEAHFLFPQRYAASTIPFRLNYVRSQVLEAGCPVALINTPQFLDAAARRFEKITGWNIAQWRGRIMREVQLPSKLSDADMLAVVKIHFPSLRESLARAVVVAALISESFLFAVEKIARNARAEARKAGRSQIEAPDIDAGIRLAGFKLPTVAPARIRDVAPAPAPVRPREVAPPSLPSRRAATSADLLGASSRATRPAVAVETTNT